MERAIFVFLFIIIFSLFFAPLDFLCSSFFFWCVEKIFLFEVHSVGKMVLSFMQVFVWFFIIIL